MWIKHLFLQFCPYRWGAGLSYPLYAGLIFSADWGEILWMKSV